MNTKYFMYLCIFQYLMDRKTNTRCNDPRGEALLIIHHIVSTYLFFGPFFFNPLHHLIFCLITLIHWFTYKVGTGCILTVYTNKYCGNKIDKPFFDLFRAFGLALPNFFHHWFLLAMIILYDLCLVHS